MKVKLSVQEVITYEKVVNMSEGEYAEFMTDSPDLAFDIYEGYMSLEDIVKFEYTNAKIDEA